MRLNVPVGSWRKRPASRPLIIRHPLTLLSVSFPVFERSGTTNELIAEDTKRPVIHELVMCPAFYHLRWKIVECAAHCRATVRRGVNRPPKITDLDFSGETEK